MIFLVLLILYVEYLLYDNHRTSFEHSNKTKFHSVFQSGNNERFFRLGQRFSHINLDLLVSIQTSSTQTLTYYCEKS